AQDEQALVEEPLEALPLRVTGDALVGGEVRALLQEQLAVVHRVGHDVAGRAGGQSDLTGSALGAVGVLEEALAGEQAALEPGEETAAGRRLGTDVVAHPRHGAGLGRDRVGDVEGDLEQTEAGSALDLVAHGSHPRGGSLGPSDWPKAWGLCD